MRVRVDRQSVSVSADRFATGRCLANRSGEDILRDVIVNRQVADREGGIGVAFHQLIVAIPSEDVRESFNTFAGVSGNGNLTTVTNLIDREFDGIDNRIRTDKHCVEAICFACRRSLEHTHPEYSRFVNSRSQSGLCSTPNLVSSSCVALVPSVGKITIVVVTKISGQRNHTIRADCVFRRSDFNNNRIVDIYIIRSAFNAATIRVVNNNCIDVCIILRTSDINNGVVCSSSFTNCIVVEQPSVGQVCTHIVVSNISGKHNHAVFADDRIASDNHCRVRVNRQSIRCECSNRLTSGRSL